MPDRSPPLHPASAAPLVYLDYAATTPVDRRVAQKMWPYLTEMYGNPASRSHAYGWAAEEAVELAREQVCALINADPREIVWTSGATESNNLAIKGAAHFYAGSKGRHIVTVTTEHKAVIDPVRELERQGFEATFLDPEPNGLVDPEKFRATLRPDTVLASVRKTGRLLIVSEASERGSFAMTLAANITRFAFADLKAPPRVLGAPNWIVPGADLESTYFPQADDIVDVVTTELFPGRREARRGVRGWDDQALARRGL